jgi:hypothetical protein
MTGVDSKRGRNAKNPEAVGWRPKLHDRGTCHTACWSVGRRGHRAYRLAADSRPGGRHGLTFFNDARAHAIAVFTRPLPTPCCDTCHYCSFLRAQASSSTSIDLVPKGIRLVVVVILATAITLAVTALIFEFVTALMHVEPVSKQHTPTGDT